MRMFADYANYATFCSNESCKRLKKSAKQANNWQQILETNTAHTELKDFGNRKKIVSGNLKIS